MAKRRKLSILAGALLALGVATAVWAYFTAIGTGTGNASIASLGSPSPVGANPGVGSAQVTWSSVSSPSSIAADVTFTAHRSFNGGGYTAAGGTCAGTLANSILSCDDPIATAGSYVYRVTAHFRTWTSMGTSPSVGVIVDVTPPTSAITFPAAAYYGPTAYTAGCAPDTDEVCGTSSDPGSGASGVNKVQVAIQRGADAAYWNGSAWVSGAVWLDASGTTLWSYGFSGTNLTEGESYSVRSRAIDNVVLTQTTPDTESFLFESEPPLTTITITPASPDGAGSWYKTIPSFTLSASDAGPSGIASSHYRIDAGPQQAYAAAVPIPQGQHTISYWSVDNAGNLEGAHTTATIKIDASAPVTMIAISPVAPNGSNGWYKTTAPTFTLTASDAVGGNSGLNGTYYQIDGGTQETYAGAVTVPEGRHTITYWSQDVAGNAESSSATAVIKVDTVAPTLAVKVTAPATSGRTLAAGISGTTIYFQACTGDFGFRFVSTVSDEMSGQASANYPAILDGEANTPARWSTHNNETVGTPSGGPYASSDFLWNPNNCTGNIAETPAPYAIVASDSAGNTITSTFTFVDDHTAPSVPTVKLNDGGTPNAIQPNDYVEATYNEVMDASSFCSTWTNGSTQSLTSGVTVTVTTADVLTVAAEGCSFRFGAVTLGKNYNSQLGVTPLTFTTGSSLTWDPTARKLTIVLGARCCGTITVQVGNASPSYRNTATTRESDFAQNPIPTTSLNGTISGF